MPGISLSFDRDMAKEFGVNAALVYKELYRKQFYWKEQGKLVDGFFWCDQIAIADWLLMSRSTIGRIVQQLKDAGLVETGTHFKPGTNTTTTWWKVSKWEPEMSHGDASCGMYHGDASHIKADTKADTVGESQSGTSSEASSERIKPAQLYSRVHSFFGGRHDRRKTMVEAIEKLQEELTDETILTGCQEIASHPTFKTKDGSEVTWTLSMLLLRDDDGLKKTADIILKAADKKDANEKKKESKVKYNLDGCY